MRLLMLLLLAGCAKEAALGPSMDKEETTRTREPASEAPQPTASPEEPVELADEEEPADFTAGPADTGIAPGAQDVTGGVEGGSLGAVAGEAAKPAAAPARAAAPEPLLEALEEEEREEALALDDDMEAVADADEPVSAESTSRPERKKAKQNDRPRFAASTGSSTSGGRRASQVDAASLEAARSAFRSGEGAIDLDGDGTPDWYVSAAAVDGLPRTEALDVDGDGRMDITTRLEGDVRETRQDVDQDGRPEQVTTVQALADGGSLREDFYDTDGDGDLDLRVQTTLAVSEGYSQRIEWVDRDGDGRWELVGATRLPLDQPSLARVQRSGAGACTDAQVKRIDKALDRAIERGHQGLSSTNPALAMRFLRRLVVADVEVRCGWDTSKLAACAVSPGAAMASAWTGPGAVDIRLSGMAFSRDAGCDPLDATLFHEVLHYVVGIHPAQDGREDPGDLIYGCQETCFGVSTAQSCAACRGSRVSDPVCSDLPDLGCTAGKVPGLCVDDGALYASTSLCEASCRGSCLSRGPCRP